MNITHVVIGLCFNGKGEALMGLRHAHKKRGGLWEWPGGKVDGDEDSRAALGREWREELGVDIDVQRRLGATYTEFPEGMAIGELFTIYFAGELKALDHAELRWVTPNDAALHLPCSPFLYQLLPLVRLYRELAG